MRQALHLLIVHGPSRTALAAHYGTRWLLPVIECDERTRADPKVVRWTADRGVDCDVTGQWLGRVSLDVTDWIVVLRASHLDRPADAQLRWTALETLTSTPALIEYQGRAIGRVLDQQPIPSLPGPFGGFDWIEEVKDWIRAAAGELAWARVAHFRSSVYEVVLRAKTKSGDVYFKGLTGGRASEPRLTRALAGIAPAHFAPTLALEEHTDGSVWWLAAACAGGPAPDAAAVARALAEAQRRVIASPECCLELPTLDLNAALRWGIQLIDDQASAARLTKRVGVVLNAAVPQSWIPMDLHPTNVLADPAGGVRFIDLDESFLGPAPLAAALYALRTCDSSCRRAYEQSWNDALTDAHWVAFEATATLVEAWLDWHRYERKVRRGEVFGEVGIAASRIRHRLLSSAHRW